MWVGGGIWGCFKTPITYEKYQGKQTHHQKHKNRITQHPLHSGEKPVHHEEIIVERVLKNRKDVNAGY